MKKYLIPVLAIVLCAAVLLGAAFALKGVAESNAQAEHLRLLQTLALGSENFVVIPYAGEDANIRSIHQGETGFVIETVTQGYVGEIAMMIGVNNDGHVTGLVVRDLSETIGLGRNALTDHEFLAQFLNTSGEAAVGENVDAITGATVTSKAVTRSVNSAIAVVTGVDATTTATVWGG